MYTPLYSALLEFSAKNRLGFHTPGHIGGRELEGFASLADIDVTELAETDDLFCAAGPIAEAERASGAFFGAEKTRFLTGGSSAGALAMVGAVVREGEKIICDRFCHRSLISALIFSGADPVWISPKTLEGGALWGGISPASVEAAITANPDAKAVFITSPNYFGFCSDVEAIAAAAHSRGLPLLVDGAHGAHFGLSPLLPPPPWRLGADITVAGAHKTLPALTQTAYLHINGEFPRLETMLRMHQSSSPSYILMASLDFARAKLEAWGEAPWTELVRRLRALFPEQETLSGQFVKYRDATRLIIPTGGSPFRAAEKLRLDYGIDAECCCGNGVVCIAHPSHTREELARLRRAAEELAGEPATLTLTPSEGRYPVSPRRAFYSDFEQTAPEAAVGRVCALEAVPYPPGVPLIVPGQLITEGDVAALTDLLGAGAEIRGLEGGKLRVISD